MKRGIVLIANNSERYNYVKMAEITAKRIHKFLNLPVSLITNSSEYKSDLFEKIYVLKADESNYRKKNIWLNKNRFKVFDISPYYETLLLDVDYVINSDNLLNCFNYESDFVCHNDVTWAFKDTKNEMLHANTVSCLWATVIKFNKTNRAKYVFELMEMIQTNYQHYADLYKFLPYTFRNDYALTIAHKIVNGHLINPEDYFNWNLYHLDNDIDVIKENETSFTFINTDKKTNKKYYIKVKNFDFHMLNKDKFLEILS